MGTSDTRCGAGPVAGAPLIGAGGTGRAAGIGDWTCAGLAAAAGGGGDCVADGGDPMEGAEGGVGLRPGENGGTRVGVTCRDGPGAGLAANDGDDEAPPGTRTPGVTPAGSAKAGPAFADRVAPRDVAAVKLAAS